MNVDLRRDHDTEISFGSVIVTNQGNHYMVAQYEGGEDFDFGLINLDNNEVEILTYYSEMEGTFNEKIISTLENYLKESIKEIIKDSELCIEVHSGGVWFED